jgi:hypothetical protein
MLSKQTMKKRRAENRLVTHTEKTKKEQKNRGIQPLSSLKSINNHKIWVSHITHQYQYHPNLLSTTAVPDPNSAAPSLSPVAVVHPCPDSDYTPDIHLHFHPP